MERFPFQKVLCIDLVYRGKFREGGLALVCHLDSDTFRISQQHVALCRNIAVCYDNLYLVRKIRLQRDYINRLGIQLKISGNRVTPEAAVNGYRTCLIDSAGTAKPLP